MLHLLKFSLVAVSLGGTTYAWFAWKELDAKVRGLVIGILVMTFVGAIPGFVEGARFIAELMKKLPAPAAPAGRSSPPIVDPPSVESEEPKPTSGRCFRRCWRIDGAWRCQRWCGNPPSPAGDVEPVAAPVEEESARPLACWRLEGRACQARSDCLWRKQGEWWRCDPRKR
jgi:hypothetical protein